MSRPAILSFRIVIHARVLSLAKGRKPRLALLLLVAAFGALFAQPSYAATLTQIFAPRWWTPGYLLYGETQGDNTCADSWCDHETHLQRKKVFGGFSWWTTVDVRPFFGQVFGCDYGGHTWRTLWHHESYSPPPGTPCCGTVGAPVEYDIRSSEVYAVCYC